MDKRHEEIKSLSVYICFHMLHIYVIGQYKKMFNFTSNKKKWNGWSNNKMKIFYPLTWQK